LGLAKVVAKALVWTSLESFALSGLSLISLVIFARLLSAEQFGVVAVALAIVQVLAVPVELMFHDALIQRAEVEAVHVDSAFTVSVLLGSALCGACWLLADLAARWMGDPQLADVLRWMSFSLVGSGFGSVLVAVQRRKLQFRSLALRSMIGRAGSALIALTMAFMGAGLWSLVAQQVLLVCLATAMLWLLAEERPRFRFAWQPTRELLRFGLFSTLYQLLVIFTSRIFMVLVGVFLGSESAGLLSIAFRGLDMLRDLLIGAVSQIAMPLFSRLRESGEVLFDAYTRSIQLTTLCAFPVFVGLAVCAEEVVTVAFGPQWLGAAPYFVLIALLCLETFLRMYGATMVQALGRPGMVSLEIAAQAAFVVVGMYLVGRSSAFHALGVWSARLLVSVPIDMWVQRRVTGMGFTQQLRGAGVPTLAALAMGGVVVLVKYQLLASLSPQLRLWPLALVGLLSYAGAVWAIDRSVVLQLSSFVGQTLRRRSSG
jgi:O-antigen/teichoic acid export membrane protein